MSEHLGDWITEKFVKPDPNYAYTRKLGFQRFKVRLSLDKANLKRLKAILYEEKAWNRLLDLTVDVWGSAGPDCCIMPA